MSGGSAEPATTEAPPEVSEILAHLSRHRHVRGCVTLTLAEARVIWYGGVAFEDAATHGSKGAKKLSEMIAFVKGLLSVTNEHVNAQDAGVRTPFSRTRLTEGRNEAPEAADAKI